MIFCGESDSGEYKSLENDFKYLYWTISKKKIEIYLPEGSIHDWLGRAAIRPKKPRNGTLATAQEWTNRIPNATYYSIVHFLLLPGSHFALLRLLSTYILV